MTEMSPRTPCNRRGCDGHVRPTGFCDTCKRKPLPPGDVDRGDSGSRDSSSSRARTWRAGDLVDLPVLDIGDPLKLVRSDAQLAEEDRFCPGCDAPVGRSRKGKPGKEDGFCTKCGAQYSFSIKLAEDDLVGGRYLVRGVLARGGLGWVYLAQDTHLEKQPVVLKGLLNTADAKGKDLVANERDALLRLNHQNVVRIQDFVRHPDPTSKTGAEIDYIVMEYVGGPALSQLKTGSAWQAEHGPMTPEQVIAYVLEILGALEYLHGEQLLYCDMKPANVIRGRDRLTVIDLGAVRTMTDTDPESIGTTGFRVCEEERNKHGLTVRSDLHTVGKTLEQLYQVTAEAITDRHQPGPLSIGLRSLRHVAQRALDTYDRRFASAEEMAEQLEGVLREIVALRERKVEPRPSRIFVEPTVLLDGGLGSVPSLSYWLHSEPDREEELADRVPAAKDVALALPAPLVPADDPGASILATLTTTDPDEVIERLNGARVHNSAEVHLRACRAYIERDDLTNAKARLQSAKRLLPTADWRLTWYEGLIALAQGAVAAADAEFTKVYRDLPGEVAPKLALAWCAELRDRPEVARPFHRAVWLRDRSSANALFGLARVEIAAGARDAAVAHLDRIAEPSRYASQARIAAIRVRCGLLPGEPVEPRTDDVSDAVRRLTGLSTLDGGEADGRDRARLATLVRTAAVGVVEDQPKQTRPREWHAVLGPARTVRQVRHKLADSLRTLALQARRPEDHNALVDRANQARPRTFL